MWIGRKVTSTQEDCGLCNNTLEKARLQTNRQEARRVHCVLHYRVRWIHRVLWGWCLHSIWTSTVWLWWIFQVNSKREWGMNCFECYFIVVPTTSTNCNTPYLHCITNWRPIIQSFLINNRRDIYPGITTRLPAGSLYPSQAMHHRLNHPYIHHHCHDMILLHIPNIYSWY
jgi:hypothetical protein